MEKRKEKQKHLFHEENPLMCSNSLPAQEGLGFLHLLSHLDTEF